MFVNILLFIYELFVLCLWLVVSYYSLNQYIIIWQAHNRLVKWLKPITKYEIIYIILLHYILFCWRLYVIKSMAINTFTLEITKKTFTLILKINCGHKFKHLNISERSDNDFSEPIFPRSKDFFFWETILNLLLN